MVGVDGEAASGKRQLRAKGPREEGGPGSPGRASERLVAMLWPFLPNVWCGQPQALPCEPSASLRGY